MLFYSHMPGRLDKLLKVIQPVDWLVMQSSQQSCHQKTDFMCLVWCLGMAFISFYFILLVYLLHTTITLQEIKKTVSDGVTSTLVSLTMLKRQIIQQAKSCGMRA